jgi:hypothetical protein
MLTFLGVESFTLVGSICELGQPRRSQPPPSTRLLPNYNGILQVSLKPPHSSLPSSNDVQDPAIHRKHLAVDVGVLG